MMWFARFVLLLEFPLIWGLFAMGACIGSFLNVCILRIPEGTFFKHARSVCPACGKKIPFYLNIPVFGFLLLRGRAACCHTKLSWQYPLIELVTAVIFVALYFRFPFLGWSSQSVTFDVNETIRYAHAATFISLMLLFDLMNTSSEAGFGHTINSSLKLLSAK